MKLPSGIITFFHKIPESDMVELEPKELILCKDCKYNLDGLCDQISLDWHPFRVKDDEFCAWAERKEK